MAARGRAERDGVASPGLADRPRGAWRRAVASGSTRSCTRWWADRASDALRRDPRDTPGPGSGAPGAVRRHRASRGAAPRLRADPRQPRAGRGPNAAPARDPWPAAGDRRAPGTAARLRACRAGPEHDRPRGGVPVSGPRAGLPRQPQPARPDLVLARDP